MLPENKYFWGNKLFCKGENIICIFDTSNGQFLQEVELPGCYFLCFKILSKRYLAIGIINLRELDIIYDIWLKKNFF